MSGSALPVGRLTYPIWRTVVGQWCGRTTWRAARPGEVRRPEARAREARKAAHHHRAFCSKPLHLIAAVSATIDTPAVPRDRCCH